MNNQSENKEPDDNIVNHLRNIKVLQAKYSGKRFFVECFPTDFGALQFPNTNLAVKEISLPDLPAHPVEEKEGKEPFKFIEPILFKAAD